MQFTKNDPIFLPEEQHAQIKQNLATLLKDTFSIENQSDGKLEYLTARIMGFDNHQQRKAWLKQHQEKLSEFDDVLSMPVQSILLTSVWPAGVLRVHQGSIPADSFETLKARGWFDQGAEHGYRDLEIEFRYDGTNDTQEPSFNFRLSIDENDKCVHFMIGENLGDGFSEHVAVALSDWSQNHDRDYWRNSVAALKDSRRSSRAAVRFAEAFEKHKEASNALLDEIDVVITWLSGGELPARS